MTKPPQHLLRFYGNIQYALESIALKQVTFLNVDKLNDPFDPYYYFETDFNENYQQIINYLKQYHPEHLLSFQNDWSKENWEWSINQIQEHLSWSCNNAYIFSAIEIREDKHPKDNLYMWSHYGDGHRGVAIEFDTHLLAKTVLQQLEKPDGAPTNANEVWSVINYENEPPKITCEHIVHYIMGWDKTKLENIMNRRLSSKCLVWETEKEWRLMWRNDETRLKTLKLDLIDDTITAVYFGCRIANNIMDDLIFETKRNFSKAEIFRARKAKGKFELDFERISVSANENLM